MSQSIRQTLKEKKRPGQCVQGTGMEFPAPTLHVTVLMSPTCPLEYLGVNGLPLFMTWITN